MVRRRLWLHDLRRTKHALGKEDDMPRVRDPGMPSRMVGRLFSVHELTAQESTDGPRTVLGKGAMRVAMRVACLLLVLFAMRASATSFTAPVKHDVPSRNGAFVLAVDPDTEIHVVSAATDRGTPLWSFSSSTWHEPMLVSDDGRVVARLPWLFTGLDAIGNGVGIEFRDASGLFRIQPLSTVCPDPERTDNRGPIGPDWRTWMHHVEDRGTTFEVTTTCGEFVELRYADGEIVHRSMTRDAWLLLVSLGGFATVTAALVLGWRVSVLPDPTIGPRGGAVLRD
jgi:hypothetical protein